MAGMGGSSPSLSIGTDRSLPFPVLCVSPFLSSLQWPLQLVWEEGWGCFRLRAVHTQLCGQGFWMEGEPPLVGPSSLGVSRAPPHPRGHCGLSQYCSGHAGFGLRGHHSEDGGSVRNGVTVPRSRLPHTAQTCL